MDATERNAKARSLLRTANTVITMILGMISIALMLWIAPMLNPLVGTRVEPGTKPVEIPRSNTQDQNDALGRQEDSEQSPVPSRTQPKALWPPSALSGAGAVSETGAQDTTLPEEVRAYSVAWLGQKVAVGLADRVVLYDASDPSEPVYLGRTQDLGSEVQQVVASGETVFASVNSLDADSVLAIDVSEPQNPQIIRTIMTGFAVSGIEIDGNTLFVAVYNEAVYRFDVSNPKTPIQRSRFSVEAAFDVAVSEKIVALLVETDPVWFPPSPTVQAEELAVSTIGEARVHQSIGPELYLLDRDSGSVLATLELEDRPSSLIIAQDHVFTATTNGVEIVDVTNPDAPVSVAYHPMRPDSRELMVREGYLYAAIDNWEFEPTVGLEIVDIRELWRPKTVATATFHGGASALALSGDTLALGSDEGLHLVDVGDPLAPQARSGPEQTRTWLGSAVIDDDVMFLADRYRGLIVVDVSDPNAPEELNVISLSSPKDFMVGDPRVQLSENELLMSWTNKLFIFDVSDRTKPQQIGAFDGFGFMDPQVKKIDRSGDLVLLSTSGRGVHALDISDRSKIVHLGHIHSIYPVGAHFLDDHVYVVSFGGLRVFDVSDWSAPVRRGSSIDENGYVGMMVRGDVIFCAANGEVKSFEMKEGGGLKVLGSVAHDIAWTETLFEMGDHLYVQAGRPSRNLESPDFVIVETASDGTMTTLGGFSTGLFAHWLRRSGDLAVLAYGDGYQLLDVSKISQPMLLFDSEDSGQAQQGLDVGRSLLPGVLR